MGVQFELFVIGYLQLDTHVIHLSITCALMASMAMFSTVFKTSEKRYRRFRSREVSHRTFLISKFVIDFEFTRTVTG